VCCASLGCTQVLDFDSVSTSVGQGGGGGSSNDLGKGCSTLNPAPTLCHDFDTAALNAFGIQVGKTNGSGDIDTALAVSKPGSFLAISNGKGNSRIVLEKAFGDFKDAKVLITVKFDVYVEEMDATPKARISPFFLLFGPLSSTNQVGLQFLENAGAVAGRLVENAVGVLGPDGFRTHDFDNGLTLQRWTAVRIELSIQTPSGTGGPNVAKVFLDNAKVLETSLNLTLKGDVPRAELGIADVETYERPTVLPWKVRYDNYVVDFIRL
jgi:hypothetical protein